MYGKFVMSGYTAQVTGNKHYTGSVTDVPGVWIELRDTTPYNQFVKSGGTITRDSDQTHAVVAKDGNTEKRRRTATSGSTAADNLNVDTAAHWDVYVP
jgi:hypothetical protein